MAEETTGLEIDSVTIEHTVKIVVPSSLLVSGFDTTPLLGGLAGSLVDVAVGVAPPGCAIEVASALTGGVSTTTT